jgi:hypothetical protein
MNKTTFAAMIASAALLALTVFELVSRVAIVVNQVLTTK